MKRLDKRNEKEMNEILESLRNILIGVLKGDIRRIKLRNFILDKKETEKVENRYLTISEIKTLKRNSKDDRDFLYKLGQYINSDKFKESVKKYHVIYEFIIKILLEKEKSKHEIPILERLKQVVDTKDKELIIGYIKKHTEDIRLWLETFKEEKIKHELVYLLYLINEDEIEYTRKKLEELKPLNKDINPFIEKIILGLKAIGEKQKGYDKKLIKELKNLKKPEIELKEKEIEYLNSELTNIEKWQVRGYSEQYFYQILAAYEIQVKDIVRVLRDTYKDEELKSMIQKSPAIRNLVFYAEEIHYFDRHQYYDHDKKIRLGLLGMVYKGAKEGDWKDFETVVKNVKKESKFVKERFGDRTYGDRLLLEEAKKHESLLDWEADLAQIVKELKGYSNLNKVLENAKARLKEKINRKLKLLYDELKKEKGKLKDVLERRITYLINENKKAITKLDKTVTKRLKELRNIEKVSVRKIMNKIRIETIKINIEWRRIRRKYGKVENKFGNYLGDFMYKFTELSEKLDVKENVDNIMLYINSSQQYKRYFKRFSDTLDLNNARKASPNIHRMGFANAVLADIDDSITELSDESFSKVINSSKDIHELNKLKDPLKVTQKNVLDYLNYIESIYFNKNEVNKIISRIVKPIEMPKNVRI